jgi:hypothetical protein
LQAVFYINKELHSPIKIRHSFRMCPKIDLWLIFPMYPVVYMVIFLYPMWGGGGNVFYIFNGITSVYPCATYLLTWFIVCIFVHTRNSWNIAHLLLHNGQSICTCMSNVGYAHLECSRSWVRALVRYDQKLGKYCLTTRDHQQQTVGKTH